MKELEEKLKELIKILKSEYNLEAIVLFSSYARNTQNKESDIDIAIKSDKEININEIREKIEDFLKIDVDLINLDKINDSFKYEILISGKTLYCKDKLKFELYKLDMYRNFLELNESRQDIINIIKNGGDVYGKFQQISPKL